MLSNKNGTHRRHAEAAPLAQVWWQCREGENDGRFHPLGEAEIAELLPNKRNGNKQKYRSTNDNCYMKNVSETLGGRLTKFYAEGYNSLPFNIPILREKVPLSCTFYRQMVPLSKTEFRTLHPF